MHNYYLISVVISVGTQTDEEYINQGKCMIHSVSSSTEQNYMSEVHLHDAKCSCYFYLFISLLINYLLLHFY